MPVWKAPARAFAYNEVNGTNYTTADLTTSTDPAEAIAALDARWRRRGTKIVGFAHADFVHWHTGTWIEQAGLKGKFANGGFDLVPGVIDAIKKGPRNGRLPRIRTPRAGSRRL